MFKTLLIDDCILFYHPIYWGWSQYITIHYWDILPSSAKGRQRFWNTVHMFLLLEVKSLVDLKGVGLFTSCMFACGLGWLRKTCFDTTAQTWWLHVVGRNPHVQWGIVGQFPNVSNVISPSCCNSRPKDSHDLGEHAGGTSLWHTTGSPVRSHMFSFKGMKWHDYIENAVRTHIRSLIFPRVPTNVPLSPLDRRKNDVFRLVVKMTRASSSV